MPSQVADPRGEQQPAERDQVAVDHPLLLFGGQGSNFARMAGSATVTMVEPSTIMNWATHETAAIAPRRRARGSGGRTAVAGIAV